MISRNLCCVLLVSRNVHGFLFCFANCSGTRDSAIFQITWRCSKGCQFLQSLTLRQANWRPRRLATGTCRLCPVLRRGIANIDQHDEWSSLAAVGSQVRLWQPDLQPFWHSEFEVWVHGSNSRAKGKGANAELQDECHIWLEKPFVFAFLVFEFVHPRLCVGWCCASVHNMDLPEYQSLTVTVCKEDIGRTLEFQCKGWQSESTQKILKALWCLMSFPYKSMCSFQLSFNKGLI